MITQYGEVVDESEGERKRRGDVEEERPSLVAGHASEIITRMVRGNKATSRGRGATPSGGGHNCDASGPATQVNYPGLPSGKSPDLASPL
jgi:hypothetical protein